MQFTKPFIAAALGLSMISAPVLAQSAAPLSIAHATSRVGATTQDANDLEGNGGYLIPAIAIIAVLAAAILISSNHNNDDLPMSA